MKTPRFKDITGQRFCMLVAVAPTELRKHGTVVWECICDCGNSKLTTARNLQSGYTKTCGCSSKRVEFESKDTKFIRNHKLYVTWSMMRKRCYVETNAEYHRYGARGIKVCDRWLEGSGKGFYNFLQDIGEKPPGTSLDRIDPNGNYEPSNCRWATFSEQSYNQRVSKRCHTGVPGVRKHGNGWLVRLQKSGKLVLDKVVKDYEEAVKIRLEAEEKYYGYSPKR